jgi:hypothetical protein
MSLEDAFIPVWQLALSTAVGSDPVIWCSAGSARLTLVLWTRDLPVTVSTLRPMHTARLYGIPAPPFGIRRPALPIPNEGKPDAERENHMAVTDSQTLQRLRREEGLAEQQGRQASNIAGILKNHPQYGAARQKADALLAKASALRGQIVKIETTSEVE